MIRVRRGTEPRALATARKKRLAAATEAHLASGTVSEDLLTGYKLEAVTAHLHTAQHGKCAWCEQPIRLTGAHIEHYRPKNGAWRHRRRVKPHEIDPHCYWWLTWTWENLLLSCGPCNNPANKGNYFWLKTPWTALAGGVWPAPHDVTKEQPLLIDPASQDPLDHIRWAPVDPTPARKQWLWTPVAHAGSLEGAATIEMLRLDWQLVDLVGDHLRGPLLDAVEEVEEHLEAKRFARANVRWARLLDSFLGARAPYRAASWCALARWGIGNRGLSQALKRP